MTIYDGVMIGLLVLGMLWGAIRGFTWQVASLASLVAGYLAAHQFSARLVPYLRGEPIVVRSLSMIVIYAVVSGLIFTAAWLIRATIKKLRFEAFDRHLGMVLGGIEGSLLGVIGTFFVVSLAPSAREPIFQSESGKVVGHLMDAVGPVLPEEARSVLTRFWDGSIKTTPDSESVRAIARRMDRRSEDQSTTVVPQDQDEASHYLRSWITDQFGDRQDDPTAADNYASDGFSSASLRNRKNSKNVDTSGRSGAQGGPFGKDGKSRNMRESEEKPSVGNAERRPSRFGLNSTPYQR
jgi:uncharacterized membrane protein required for colicin V production